MKTTTSAKRLYAVNRDLGLCVVCSRHAAPYAKCERCRIKHAARAKRWRDKP